MKSGKTRIMPKAKRGGPPPIDTSYEAIGKRLKCLRLAFGKTQQQIANIVGVTVGMISSCEHGGARLSADHMMMLVVEFDASMDWLYFGTKRHISNELRRKLDQVDLGSD